MEIGSDSDESGSGERKKLAFSHSLMLLAQGDVLQYNALKEMSILRIYDKMVAEWRKNGGKTKAEKLIEWQEGKRDKPV
jgi:hypothetical protein